jgi:hypothetical protein
MMAARSARWHDALKLALQKEEGMKHGELLTTLYGETPANAQMFGLHSLSARH